MSTLKNNKILALANKHMDATKNGYSRASGLRHIYCY
jgi:hypothetical protein